MPCTGSVKSGDSTMLSCLSPRRPCCGPNAAASSTSGSAASASSACVEIARHGRGMREQRDALAAQALAQRARSEQPIEAELHRALPSSSTAKPAASWKSGFFARVLQRAVRAAARAVLDDGREADAPRPWCVGERTDFYGGRHMKLVGRLRHGNRRGRRELERPHPLPVAVERVRCPLRRRREIELEVARPLRRRDERLEARVLPQSLSALRSPPMRERELRHVAREPINEAQRRAASFELRARCDRERHVAHAAAMRDKSKCSVTDRVVRAAAARQCPRSHANDRRTPSDT